MRLVALEDFEKRTYKSDIRLVYVGSQAHVAVYIVDLGRFRFTVKLLNLPGKAPKETVLNSGGFGGIVSKEVTGELFVAKVIKVPPNSTTLEEAILEVAVSKLCAIYGIGPDV